MKGQSSIEFMILLSLVLLTSSILLSDLNDKAADLQIRQDFSEAQKVARMTDYYVELAKINENTSIELSYPSELSQNYIVELNHTEAEVYYQDLTASFTVRYDGDPITFDTSESYTLTNENGGVKVE